jgi:hypothetical protein
MHNQNQELLS